MIVTNAGDLVDTNGPARGQDGGDRGESRRTDTGDDSETAWLLAEGTLRRAPQIADAIALSSGPIDLEDRAEGIGSAIQVHDQDLVVGGELDVEQVEGEGALGGGREVADHRPEPGVGVDARGAQSQERKGLAPVLGGSGGDLGRPYSAVAAVLRILDS
jgi:hypothetical protein